MESGKRKRSVEAEVGATREKVVSEEEVEEFFAILRRIHMAVKYFEKNNCEGMAAKRWRPSFEWEDFKTGAAGIKVGHKGAEESMEENAGLDLNVSLATEDSSVQMTE